MNRPIRIVIVVIVTSLAFPAASLGGESPPFGPPKPPIAAWQFCYAFGSGRDAGAMTYYTGVFQATARELTNVQSAFRRYLAEEYGSQPDPRSGDQDITCVFPAPSAQSAAQQQMDTYAANMRRGGGKVVETRWQYAAAPAAAPAPPKPAALPADPRIARATPELRGLLEERSRHASGLCPAENRQLPVYDCACYGDRVVIATLDQGARVVQGVDEALRPVPVLAPPMEIVIPRADLHTCVILASLPKRGFDRAMTMSSGLMGEAQQRLARCMADDAVAGWKAKPGLNIQQFDNLVLNAFGSCMAKVQ